MVENLYGDDETSVSSSGLVDARNPQLQDLIARLQDKDAYERQRAAITLGNLGDAGAVEPLIRALKDEDLFVRNFAARSLGDLGDIRAVDPLIEAMGDSSLLVRRSAVEALGNIGDSKAVDPLIKAAKNGRDILRRAAVEALGRIGDARGIGTLIEALQGDDSYIRDGASIALANIGDPAIPELVQSLPNWAAGPAAAKILKDLGWQPSTDKERIWTYVAERNGRSLLDDWETAKRVFRDSLKSGNNQEVLSAVYALIGIGRDEMTGELVNTLQEKGTVTIAEAYMNCGNDVLRNAARDWALRSGTEIDTGDQNRVVEWGGFLSS
jgi:HEAT repeat protein